MPPVPGAQLFWGLMLRADWGISGRQNRGAFLLFGCHLLV